MPTRRENLRNPGCDVALRAMKAKEVMPILNQSDFARLAGGTIPFIRKYSTI
jgi:hypothetical protein